MDLKEMTAVQLNDLINSARNILVKKDKEDRESARIQFLKSEKGKTFKKEHQALIKKANKLCDKPTKVNLVAHICMEISLSYEEEDLHEGWSVEGRHLFYKTVTGKVTDIEGVNVNKKEKAQIKHMFNSELEEILQSACDDVYDLFPEVNKQTDEIAEEFDALKDTLYQNGLCFSDLENHQPQRVMKHTLTKLDEFLNLPEGTSYGVMVLHEPDQRFTDQLAGHKIQVNEDTSIPKEDRSAWKILAKKVGLSQEWWMEVTSNSSDVEVPSLQDYFCPSQKTWVDDSLS